MTTNSDRFVDAANGEGGAEWREKIASGISGDISQALDEAGIVFPGDTGSPTKREKLISFLISTKTSDPTFFSTLETLRWRVEGISGGGAN